MSSPDTRVLTTHVPHQLAEEVDALAQRLERSQAWIVREALTTYVALEAKRHRLTIEALDDVDSARFIDQTDVETWADSLSGPEPLPVPECK